MRHHWLIQYVVKHVLIQHLNFKFQIFFILPFFHPSPLWLATTRFFLSCQEIYFVEKTKKKCVIYYIISAVLPNLRLHDSACSTIHIVSHFTWLVFLNFYVCVPLVYGAFLHDSTRCQAHTWRGTKGRTS